MTVQKDGCEFNPKNLPLEKNGVCKCDDHDTDYPKRTKVRLMMTYSSKYYDEFLYHDVDDYDEGEFDKKYDYYETIKFEPNTEQYWCERCYEDNL